MCEGNSEHSTKNTLVRTELGLQFEGAAKFEATTELL